MKLSLGFYVDLHFAALDIYLLCAWIGGRAKQAVM